MNNLRIIDDILEVDAPNTSATCAFRLDCVLHHQPGAQLAIEHPARFAEEIQARVLAQSP